jgi:hypothetical protein
MQLYSGADHFGNVINRGIIKRGCNLLAVVKHALTSQKCLITVNVLINEGRGGRGVVELARQTWNIFGTS